MKYPHWTEIPAITPIDDLIHLHFLALGSMGAALILVDALEINGADETWVNHSVAFVRLPGAGSTQRITPLPTATAGSIARHIVGEGGRLVAIPPWSPKQRLPLRWHHHAILAIVFAVVLGLCLAPGTLAAGLLAVPVAVAATALTHRLIRPTGGLEIRTAGNLQLDESNVVAYARARLAGERPEIETDTQRRQGAVARVNAIRQEYVGLQSDIVARIDLPALFDPTVPVTAQFQAAMVEFDDLRDAKPDEVEAAAADVEIRYATARRHAETVGLRHVPESMRDDVRRASKAAHLARRAATDGERLASLTQVRRILDVLALHYMPVLDDRLAIESPRPDRPVE